MMEVRFRKAARAEIEEAYQWYEDQRIGLGEDFLLCLEEAVEKVVRDPELYPVVHKNIRRAMVRRFPYGIYCFCEEWKLVVIAVFHGKRAPRIWKNRL